LHRMTFGTIAPMLAAIIEGHAMQGTSAG